MDALTIFNLLKKNRLLRTVYLKILERERERERPRARGGIAYNINTNQYFIVLKS